MNRSTPPRVSTWLLRRFATNDRRESMVGDLIEQYASGRSAMWYRWQVLRTIAVAFWADLREHKLLAVLAVVLWFVGTYSVSAVTGSLRQAVFREFLNGGEWRSELLRQFWVYYAVPFVFIMCIGTIAIGWLIGRVSRRHGMAMVTLCAAAQVLIAARWSVRTWNLLQAGVWPFWDFRLALMFQASCLFVLYPLCLLLGATWAAQADRGGRVSEVGK